MKRIEALRNTALDHKHCLDEFFYKFYKCYSESDEISEFKRYSDAFYYAFSNLRAHISDGELLSRSTECLGKLLALLGT